MLTNTDHIHIDANMPNNAQKLALKINTNTFTKS